VSTVHWGTSEQVASGRPTGKTKVNPQNGLAHDSKTATPSFASDRLCSKAPLLVSASRRLHPSLTTKYLLWSKQLTAAGRLIQPPPFLGSSGLSPDALQPRVLAVAEPATNSGRLISLAPRTVSRQLVNFSSACWRPCN
jgi:hypothetical protein